MLTRVQKACWLTALRGGAFLQTRVTPITTIGNQTFYSVLGVLVALHGGCGKHTDGSWNLKEAVDMAERLLGSTVCADLAYMELSTTMTFLQLADIIEQKLPTREQALQT